MSITKETILAQTNKGLDVFRHYLKGDWKVNKAFLNPFYNDTKASCNIYFDSKKQIYKINDFGDSTFSGDCFFLVGKLIQKDCKNSEDFKEILQTISNDLNIQDYSTARKANKIQSHLPKYVALPKSKNDVSSNKEAKSKVFSPPILKEFSQHELIYWQAYEINGSLLKKYNVHSVKTFFGMNKEGKTFTIESSDTEPIFTYLGKKYAKIYRPKSHIRFLYTGNLPDTYVFGMEQLPSRGDVLFITGGEKDVLSLASKGFHAICFNSETAHIPKSTLKKLRIRFKHICVLYDCDKTGISASNKIVSEHKEFRLVQIKLPLAGTKAEKDISDYFKLGKTREDFLKLFGKILDRQYLDSLTLLKSCEIDFKRPPKKPTPLVSINNVTIGSPGNILCISGSEGSGKSNFLGGLIAGVFEDENDEIDTLGTDIQKNHKGKAVLFYDTEQSEDQLFKNVKSIMNRSAITTPPPWFKAFCMVGLSRKERMQLIWESIDRFHYQFDGIHLIVIDGIADLIAGVNDETASVELVDELYKLARVYNTCLISVLHLNPSGMKLRGHLGSEIQRKAAGILSIEKDDTVNVSSVKALKVRDGSPLDVPQIQFGWDITLQRHVYMGALSKEEVQKKDTEDLFEFVKRIFKGKEQLSYSALVKEIMERKGLQETMAKNYLRKMKECSMIVKTSEGRKAPYRIVD